MAAREPGREVLFGAGESMAPVYGDGSVLVTRPIDYRQLRAGMTVVYVSIEGHRVAHRLIRLEDHGWRAQGINNDTPDAELVTPENLVGVVYASLAQEAGALPAWTGPARKARLSGELRDAPERLGPQRR